MNGPCSFWSRYSSTEPVASATPGVGGTISGLGISSDDLNTFASPVAGGAGPAFGFVRAAGPWARAEVTRANESAVVAIDVFMGDPSILLGSRGLECSFCLSGAEARREAQ